MKQTKYVAKEPDAKGRVAYTEQEDLVWAELMARQQPIVANRACDEYLEGLETLNFPEDRVPQIPDINKRLAKATGWEVAPVPALIDFDRFFRLLADKKFPAATFIRTHEELDYLQEPDIFHEFFGHCPMLSHPTYANFMQKYGELGVNATHKQRVMMARLYWFTVEFGLIDTPAGLKAYGGGILSSISETPYALESETPERKNFDILTILRTPYRIDILQMIYFIIKDYETLYDILEQDLFNNIEQAQSLGLFEPTYPPKTTH